MRCWVQFKMLAINYKALYGLAPGYLQDCISPYQDHIGPTILFTPGEAAGCSLLLADVVEPQKSCFSLLEGSPICLSPYYLPSASAKYRYNKNDI